MRLSANLSPATPERSTRTGTLRRVALPAPLTDSAPRKNPFPSTGSIPPISEKSTRRTAPWLGRAPISAAFKRPEEWFWSARQASGGWSHAPARAHLTPGSMTNKRLSPRPSDNLRAPAGSSTRTDLSGRPAGVRASRRGAGHSPVPPLRRARGRSRGLHAWNHPAPPPATAQTLRAVC